MNWPASTNEPIPRLKGQAVRNAPKERYYTECKFFTDLESGFFREMSSYLKDTLKVKCPVIATADHSHSGSGYSLVADTSQLDVVDGHTYWQHPGERNFKNAPMVNDPFNSTVIELSRTAVTGKPYTVSEVNNPFPNQFACEGIPILAAYAGFLDWSAVVWVDFRAETRSQLGPYVGDPFDMSLDPVKMPQMAAGALMFVRGDLKPAKQTVERSYSREQVMDSRFLPGTERPYFTPGFPLSVPLLHGSRIQSLNGKPTAAIKSDNSSPFKSDTGQLVWRTDTNQTGLVTIDSPRSQGLVGFVKANNQRVSNLSADVKNDFCAIIVNSLESKPIASASRLLLTACVRVENTGMQWDARRAHLTEQGQSPTLIEPVIGTITLRNLKPATKVSATALDGSGLPIGDPIIAKKTDAGWEIAVGEPVTTWMKSAWKDEIIHVSAAGLIFGAAVLCGGCTSHLAKDLVPSPLMGRTWSLSLSNNSTLDMAWMPPGTFIMGSPVAEPLRKADESPQTRVTLTKGFWLGTTMVTIGQWRKCDGIGRARATGQDAPRRYSSMPSAANSRPCVTS